jgi:Tfp pilus assembly protein PilN
LEATHASVVLVQEGLPRVVHQVVFAPGEDSARNRAELLARGVDQVSGYYHTLGSGEDSGTWPLVLTGRFSESLASALQQLSQRRTVTFGPELAWPEHFLPEEYAVNLGLFLAYQSRPKDRSRVVRSNWVSLNLLADRHMPRMVPMTPAAVFITLLLLWLHPFNVGAHVEDKLVSTNVLSGQIDVLKTRAQQHRANQALEKATEKETQELYRQRQILQLQLDELEGRMDSLLARLEAMTTTSLPPTMKLTSLIQRADEFALVGTATSYDEVLAYTENLRASGLFSDARVLKVDGWEDPDDPTAAAVSFQVEAKVPAAAEPAP